MARPSAEQQSTPIARYTALLRTKPSSRIFTYTALTTRELFVQQGPR